MEFLCDTNYILFPTSDNAQNKRLYFYIDNELVYAFMQNETGLPADECMRAYELIMNTDTD